MTFSDSTEVVTTRDGGRMPAFSARPPSGHGPGLVMLQEIYGVNATMRAGADLFAEEGYVVLVPDLFWRLQPGIEPVTDRDKARRPAQRRAGAAQHAHHGRLLRGGRNGSRGRSGGWLVWGAHVLGHTTPR